MENAVETTQTGTLPALTLVLGGARSGKSRHAETLVLGHAEAIGQQPVYIATAEARDGEMAERIAEHRARRGDTWRTEEAPQALSDALAGCAISDQPILIDCLTLWLTNIMLAELDIAAETASLLDSLGRATGPVVCVANEVGLGIVPDNALGRAFRDQAGHLNQQVAARADRVDFIAAGLPITLKTLSQTG
ncbi:MAG: bifunctional adenosylcobinamide kinase/adenosylcobinamide-phosphate guanylyltransferase [Alphaproteobacteria bacterium]|nr:bifunctional adenosylcobinamide kinase/adenosylcobinamide-phosphate guanylyltransferase [Alphaproteobacteria bacterium]